MSLLRLGEGTKPLNFEVYNPYRRLTESQKLSPQEFPFPQYTSAQNIQNGNVFTQSAVNTDVYQAPGAGTVLITDLTITLLFSNVLASGGIVVLTDNANNELATIWRCTPDTGFNPGQDNLFSINLKTAILLTPQQKIRCRVTGSGIIGVNALGYRIK